MSGKRVHVRWERKTSGQQGLRLPLRAVLTDPLPVHREARADVVEAHVRLLAELGAGAQQLASRHPRSPPLSKVPQQLAALLAGLVRANPDCCLPAFLRHARLEVRCSPACTAGVRRPASLDSAAFKLGADVHWLRAEQEPLALEDASALAAETSFSLRALSWALDAEAAAALRQRRALPPRLSAALTGHSLAFRSFVRRTLADGSCCQPETQAAVADAVSCVRHIQRLLPHLGHHEVGGPWFQPCMCHLHAGLGFL